MNGCNKPIARIGYGYAAGGPAGASWWSVDILGCINGVHKPDWLAYCQGCINDAMHIFVEFRSGERAIFDKLGLVSSGSGEFNSNKNEGGSEMNYAVVSMNLGDTGGSPLVVKYSANLDEVKAFVEAKVAGLRGNIQVKNFFSLVVVDMKTGAVIISVVDAPPTLNWNAGTPGSLS